MPGVGAAARAAFLQITQTFACRRNAASALGSQEQQAVQDSCLCHSPCLCTGSPHLPGMQYLTGGAMTASVVKPGCKRSRLLIGHTQAQFRSKMCGNWCPLSGRPRELSLRGKLHFPGCPETSRGWNFEVPGHALALMVEDGLTAGPGPLAGAVGGGQWWVGLNRAWPGRRAGGGGGERPQRLRCSVWLIEESAGCR